VCIGQGEGGRASGPPAPEEGRIENAREQRPPEVIHDHHGAEPQAGQRPGRDVLEIGLNDLEARLSRDILEPAQVAIDRRDRMAAREKQPGVATPSAGQIEDRRPGRDERREAQDPGEGVRGSGMSDGGRALTFRR
jgi:hypothetical protein